MYAQAIPSPHQVLIPRPAPATAVATFGSLLDAVELDLFHSVASHMPPSDAATAAACHLRSGGQRVRARLAIHAGLSLQLAPGDIVAIATTVELLHNASLIHDDLQDRDLLRHGVATVWSAFGDNTAICAGDLMLAMAYGALGAVTQTSLLPALLNLTLAHTSKAIHGQCLDLAGPQHDDVASYESMARAKSGALLSLPTELALLAAGRAEAMPNARYAAESFAIGYQIVDDIDDIDIDSDPLKIARSFNIVLMLQAGGQASARAAAVKLAQHHFGCAAAAAAELPGGTGDLLTTLIQRLAQRL
ncbi:MULTISPECIES: polyprenyl synthetase family protein [unclassified Janthinobacterium]|uniref:polyprenyl synthetase family protein n=1 Tax=unclassified Janthinobacterium TaxID=2610881 RepID=UPI0018C99A6E|nr:polyprenyl synthetase family protein [Janthinobacterium sp. CG_23.4]MDH6159714.1 geranylgeranyl pyrophosphate synthase [Janthinobacterium sp. CG_23.4]